jgi:acetyl-CoA carboxylase biotin carboxyl carrier protein
VTTIDFPKRDGADDTAEQAAAPTTLAELREQTRALADELPGTLRRITLRAGGLSVDVEWEGPPAPAPVQYAPVPYPAYQAAPAAETAAAQPTAQTQPAAQTQAAHEAGSTASTTTIPVTAPLVGTFYRSPSPTAEPFVKIGDVVEPGQPLAIIEAMKLLNNITSEHRAKVAAIHVDNGDIVEYGQPLLDLEPVD